MSAEYESASSALERWRKQGAKRRVEVIKTLQAQVEYYNGRLEILKKQATNEALIAEIELLRAAYKSAIFVLEE